MIINVKIMIINRSELVILFFFIPSSTLSFFLIKRKAPTASNTKAAIKDNTGTTGVNKNC